MANLSLRRTSESNVPAQQGSFPSIRGLQPFRWMDDLLHWDPFREMYPMLANVNAVFSPDFDVRETKDSYVFQVDLPGIRESDVDISITGNRLNISGKREQTQEQTEANDNYYVSERSYGAFTRSFTLPQGADLDHVQAELKDGVLTITVPKQEQAQPRKIMLGAGTGGTKGAKPAHA